MTSPQAPRTLLTDLLRCVGLLTRLRVPSRWFDGFDGRYDRAAWAFPVVGCVVGSLGAAAMVGSWLVGAPPLLASTLAVAVQAAVTGALHEDGLADFADGLAGDDAVRRIEIMRDSAVGVFGMLALVLAVLARVAALSALLTAFGAKACILLVATAAASRAAMLWPWHRTPPASATGSAAASGRPDRTATGSALLVGSILLAACVVVVPSFPLLLAFMGGALVALAMTRYATLRLGGHTGDVLGATCILAEVAILAGLATATGGYPTVPL